VEAARTTTKEVVSRNNPKLNKSKTMPEAAINTDTSIATEKDTTVTTDTSMTSMKPFSSDDDRSEDSAYVADFTPPLRIHSTRVPERLSSSSLNVPPQIEKTLRRKSGSNNSGTRSPLFDGGSSISSLEDAGIDTDILTDKMGTLELDASSSRLHNSGTNLHLQTVAERLSEETLADTHAFTDIKRGEGTASRGNSITTGGEASSYVLEPLDEEDEEEPEGGVKITNMEEILEVAEEEAGETSPPPTS
jgi:hypothetical protein